MHDFNRIQYIHFYISLFSHPVQPYKTQQRLAVAFSTLFVALAFNAVCFGPAMLLHSGDFSVSLGASICMILVNQVFSQLYIAAAQSAAEHHAVWSYHTVLTHAALLGVLVASIFLCLVYSSPFDSALSARWLHVVLISFAQSFFLTGPLWICFKTAFFIVLARFRMRGMTLQEQQKEALALKLSTSESSKTSESTCSSDGSRDAIEISTSATSAAPHSTRALPTSTGPQHGGFQEFHDDDVVVLDDDEVSNHGSHLPCTIDQTTVPSNAAVNILFANSSLADKDLRVVSAAQTPPEPASKHASIAISDAARFDIAPNITSVSDSETNSHSNSSFLVLEHNALFNPALLQAVARSEATPAASVHVPEVACSSPMAAPTPPRSGARTSLFLSTNPLFNRSALSEAVGDGVDLDEFAIPTDNRMVILSPHTISFSHNASLGMNLAAAASSAIPDLDDKNQSSGPLATQ